MLFRVDAEYEPLSFAVASQARSGQGHGRGGWMPSGVELYRRDPCSVHAPPVCTRKSGTVYQL
jgi:hypothetical protein